jgi:hypothetical protein
MTFRFSSNEHVRKWKVTDQPNDFKGFGNMTDRNLEEWLQSDVYELESSIRLTHVIGAAREQAWRRRMGRVRMMKMEQMIMLLMHCSTVH